MGENVGESELPPAPSDTENATEHYLACAMCSGLLTIKEKLIDGETTFRCPHCNTSMFIPKGYEASSPAEAFKYALQTVSKMYVNSLKEIKKLNENPQNFPDNDKEIQSSSSVRFTVEKFLLDAKAYLEQKNYINAESELEEAIDFFANNQQLLLTKGDLNGRSRPQSSNGDGNLPKGISSTGRGEGQNH